MLTKRLNMILKYSREFVRPLLSYLLILILFISFVAAPVFGFHYDIPARMYDIIELCLSILIGGRSLEKLAPVISAIKVNKKAPPVKDEASDNLSDEDNAAI